MDKRKQELIDIRQDPEFEEIKPAVRRALDYIDELENKLQKAKILAESAAQACI